jgi:hypothetical protein
MHRLPQGISLTIGYDPPNAVNYMYQTVPFIYVSNVVMFDGKKINPKSAEVIQLHASKTKYSVKMIL